jgi:hypothetical protein
VQQWEYLSVDLSGHNGFLYSTRNMVVSTSDGRFSNEVMPNDITGFFNKIGEDGWELVACGSGTVPSSRTNSYTAMFKRPKE